jgi:hypothetical protein
MVQCLAGGRSKRFWRIDGNFTGVAQCTVGLSREDLDNQSLVPDLKPALVAPDIQSYFAVVAEIERLQDRGQSVGKSQLACDVEIASEWK